MNIGKNIARALAVSWVVLLLAPNRIESATSVLRLGPASNLQAVIEASPEGARIELEPGMYSQKIVVEKSISIVGSLDPEEPSIVKSDGEGTTIRIFASNVLIANLVIDGSGRRYDLQDAAILVRGDHCDILNNKVRNATYGIVVQQANFVVVRSNLIHGNGEEHLGLRGDGIRLWETRRSIVESNHIHGVKDVMVWYSDRNQIIGNRVVGSRYGTHLMYSSTNTISGNVYVSNTVGMFAMYSRDLLVASNQFLYSFGPAGYGIGLKEAGNLSFKSNLIARNTVGVYVDVSPYDPRHKNLFEGNRIAYCQKGISFHGSPKWNSFLRNVLDNNLVQVDVDGGGTAQESQWEGNHFDDYVGYDLDGDGFGDVAYELRSFSLDLVGRHPNLNVFRGMPALGLIDFMAKAFPLLQPRLLLRDAKPTMKPKPNGH